MRRVGKATDQWMPLYVADYLGDTGRLSTEQHGAYLLIIMDYWVNGPPPDDDDVLASITRLEVKTWKRHRRSIERLFRIEHDVWRHKRVDAELERAGELVEQRRAAGKASAEARARKREGQREAQRKGNERSTSVATSVATSVPTGEATEGQRNGRPLPLPVTIEPIPIPIPDSEPARAGLPDGFDQVVAAAGLRITARNREREAAVLSGWVGIGLGLEEIINEIRRVLAEKEGPTSTLGRFDRGLRDLAARRALPKAEPPAEVRAVDAIEVDGAQAVRNSLLSEFGAKTFDAWLKPCRLVAADDGAGIVVLSPSAFMRDWIRDHFAPQIAAAAGRHRIGPVVDYRVAA
jgi:uncharacterized protein YdaU (DUF1376 family)